MRGRVPESRRMIILYLNVWTSIHPLTCVNAVARVAPLLIETG
jgi:hypothetical protein